jgi:hypothetical protein
LGNLTHFGIFTNYSPINLIFGRDMQPLHTQQIKKKILFLGSS